MEWKNVTEHFTEEERHYNGKYLEIDEVYDDVVEVSLFSSNDDIYEIYISFDIMCGIIYTEKENAHDLRDEIKEVLAKEYRTNREPTDKFIEKFSNKYEISIPNDLFFDAKNLFNLF